MRVRVVVVTVIEEVIDGTIRAGKRR